MVYAKPFKKPQFQQLCFEVWILTKLVLTKQKKNSCKQQKKEEENNIFFLNDDSNQLCGDWWAKLCPSTQRVHFKVMVRPANTGYGYLRV